MVCFSLYRASRVFLAATLVLAALPQNSYADDDYYGSDRSSSYGSSYESGSDYGSDSGSSYYGGSSDRFGSGGSRGRRERPYTLSVGSGVAAPSETAFFGENPSGLIYNRGASVLGYVAAGPQHPELISNGLSFIAGNGWAAASLGVQSYTNTSDSNGNIISFNFGASAYSRFLNTAFGLNGMYRFGNESTHGVSPGNTPTWTANIGALYNPFGQFRVGLNVYDLSKGVSAVALGMAADINRFASLTLEGSTNNRGQGLTLKPGIGVRAAHVHIAYSYGMQVDHSATSGITAGNTLGLGYEFNQSFRLDAYYNHVVPYFLGATVSF
jgi:hypothetical protein